MEMAGDRYKFSIEARPLKAIYSKYGDSEPNISGQVVRPLGCIRKDKNSSAEKKKSSTEHKEKITEKIIRGKYGVDNCVSSKEESLEKNSKKHPGVSMHKSVDVDKNKSKIITGVDKDANNNTVEEIDSAFPNINRSKSQLFEHRFKIAALRANGQESPSPPLKRHKDVCAKKRVIQLPLFRVNLKTYPVESEVTRTVAKTRESLRQLMELHRSKMKTPNMVAANIKHYEFTAPSTPRLNSFKNDQYINALSMSQPFPAKPAIRQTKARDHREFKRLKQLRCEYKFGAGNKQDVSDSNSPKSSQQDSMNKSSLKFHIPADNYVEEGSEESILTNAIRPETVLTLASTMSHMERVLKSPGSDELREISEVFTNAETPPAWPSYNDYQRMKTQSLMSKAKSINAFLRPNTVINYQKDLLPQASTPPHNRAAGCTTSFENDNHQHHHAHAHKPVLRYTSKQSTFKLDPIIVPSHTNTECPMCNIYQRDFETPCPPNSPMTGQFHLNPDLIGKDKLAGSKSFRPGRHDVLHMTRINMNGSPTEDYNTMNSMKAS